jgi:hypothetical protein
MPNGRAVDSREAREILACYRRGLDDASEPRLAAALERARQDPALAQWLDQQTAFDEALREQLREIPVPDDLRAKILARQPSRPRAHAGWRSPSWLAAAAGLAALAVLVGFWLAHRGAPFDAYRAEMARTVAGEYEIEHRSEQLDEIRSYLASRGSPTDYSLTPALQDLEAEGVSVLHWRGRNVSLLCLDAGGDRDLFLFVAPRSAFRDAPATAPPRLEKIDGLITAAWTDGDTVYFLAGHGDERFLRQYL